MPTYNSGFKCELCGKMYRTSFPAETCCDNKFILVRVLKTDMKRLAAFTMTGDAEYLTPTLRKTILKYNKLVGEEKE